MNHDVRGVYEDDEFTGTYWVTLIREVEIQVEVSHDPDTGAIEVQNWDVESELDPDERESVKSAVYWATFEAEDEKEGAA